MPILESIEKGRQEDGSRSIADKIIKRLHDLDLSVESNQGRWIWELLQNAKDSIIDNERKVKVKIELNNDNVCFKHNGIYFTEKDIRGLINQISSKELEEGEIRRKTGRFGTGFLTTHLLSKEVTVAGVVKIQSGELYRFSFPLDREGKTTSELVPKIETTWQKFHESTSKVENYNEDEFNTSFYYPLNSITKKEIAKIGIREFENLIQYVLVFVPEIESVEIIDDVENKKTIFTNTFDNEIENVAKIVKQFNGSQDNIFVLNIEKENVCIAVELTEISSTFEIKEFENTPKLFCDFPLIGSEKFHFPVIINCFDFTPLSERDGAWLKGNDEKQEIRKNKDIVENAVELYKKLLTIVTDRKYQRLYNLVNTRLPQVDDRYFDIHWYKENIQDSLKSSIKESELIETQDNERAKVGEVYFPDREATKEDREKIWEYSFALKVNTLPRKDHIHAWANVIWSDTNKCDIPDLVNDFTKNTTLTELQSKLDKNENDTIDWLNTFIDFILKIDDSISLFNQNNILPNQEGTFKTRKSVAIDNILVTSEPPEIDLKTILNELGINWFCELKDKRIKYDDCYETWDTYKIANEITSTFENRENKSDKDLGAIRMLSEWFEYNEDDGKKYFEKLFRNRAKLFLDTISDRDSLYKIMKSKTPLDQLSEIAIAIENDPEILEIIRRRQQEIKEKIDNTLIGEQIEELLQEALEDEGLTVESVWIGRDLVISLKNDSLHYDIEVKSTVNTSYVSMTPTQAKTAAFENQKNYSLCVVHKDGSTINKEYVRNKSRFVINIGILLESKVTEVEKLIDKKNNLYYNNEDINFLIENDLEYRYGVSNTIWGIGIEIDEFVKMIKKLNQE
jgi:hypothetical protein